MAKATIHPPALLLVAAFSRYPEALDWARRRVEDTWGPIALESSPFDFHETDYYQPSMGPGLKKVFFAFDEPCDPGDLAQMKLTTNDWEAEYARGPDHPEPRPLNLDPGYLTLAKLVLASAKDYAHRIYLAHGIYAEITLYYRQGRWQSHEWTFPDYQRPDYHRFLTRCRDELHRRVQQGEVQ